MRKYVKVCFIFLFVVFTVVMAALWQGTDSFLFAWVLNLMLMTGILYFTQTFKPRLKSPYYDSKKWETEGKLYKWLGVNVYRKLLVWVGWEKLNKATNPVKKNKHALKHLEYSTRQSEFGHLIIFFIVLAFTLYVGIYYGFIQSLELLILNVILNAYPIMVQRYNRPRLQKVINRLSNKTEIISKETYLNRDLN